VWSWWTDALEVALVAAAVGTKAEGQDVDGTKDGDEGGESDHESMIDHSFPFH